MTVTLDDLNAASPEHANELLRSCCGGSRWIAGMVSRRPFASIDALLRTADSVWTDLAPSDWLEAFAHHPRIGETGAAARQDERAARWSAGEQANVASAGGSVRQQLVDINRAYESRFGHIYIVCATGKSADELLSLARRRMLNDPQTELRVAAEEQRQITRLRLEKLFFRGHMSTISTHVLDTSLGKPAGGVAVLLERVRDPRSGEPHEARDVVVGAGTTDDDGRLRDFVSAGASLAEGTYRLRFDVAEYFARTQQSAFYPEIAVQFRIGAANAHYHVPVLISPYGYSTYRGS